MTANANRPPDDDNNNHQYHHRHHRAVAVVTATLLDQFQILLRHSATLLHPYIVVTEKNDFAFGQYLNNNNLVKRDDDKKSVGAEHDDDGDDESDASNVNDDDDNDDDSDDDLMRMMMGGGGGLYDSDDSIADNGNKVDGAGTYDDNDDEHQYYVDDTNLVEEEEGEDVATLLKRASSVHAALLLSLPSSLSSALRMAGNTNNDDHGNNDILLDGRKLVEELVVAILSTGHEVEGSEIMGSGNNTEKSELVNMLSFFINFSNIYRDENNSKNKYRGTTRRGVVSSSSCWNVEKVHLTSSLLAIQFLLCLNDIAILRKQDQTVLSSNRSKSDLEWGGTMSKIILPLFFGTMTSTTTHNIRTTLFLSNDALRNAVLDLISFSLGEDGIDKGQAITSTSTSTTTAASAANNATAAAVNLCLDIMRHAISSTSAASSSCSPPLLRQKIIVSICQIFIRMHDGIHKSNNNKSGGDATSIIHDAMHRTVVMLLRQISVDCRSCNTLDDSTLSPESLLRPITGLLLPKLYGCHQQHHQQQQIIRDHLSHNKQPQSENVNMNEKAGAELLWNEILLLLEEEHNNDGRHRHDNWIPMVTTALLCILLPTFRDMELPSSVAGSSSTSEIKYCRPIFQPCVWRLIRDCLGRCGGGVSSTDTTTVDVGGRGTSLLSRSKNIDDNYDNVVMDQLLRRRSAHALRLMIEHERERLIRCKTGNRTKGKGGRKRQSEQKGGNDADINFASRLRSVDSWTKYVLCFEMLEMEVELHLVDQVWATVKEITAEVVAGGDALQNFGCNSVDGSDFHLPRLMWDDIGSLLSRVLLSDTPTMRKLGLYRFLSGHTGLDVVAVSTANTLSDFNNVAVADTNTTTSDENVGKSTAYMTQPKSKGMIKKQVGAHVANSAPLSVASVDFVLDVVMWAYDSIVGTKVGINMQIEEGGQQERVSVADSLSDFLYNYTVTLATEIENERIGSTRLSEFVNKVFGSELMQSHKARSLVLYYRSVASALDTISWTGSKMLSTDPEHIQASIRSMRTIFSSGGAPKSMQQGLKLDMASMLRSSIPWKAVNASVVLKVLAFYPPPEEVMEVSSESPSSKSREALSSWILGLGDGKWAQQASPACASAFVLGKLLPFVDAGKVSGVSFAERETGMSICTLCSLSGSGSESLWPAVFKGLQSVPTTDSTTPGFCMASRSMILLEYGCKEGTLSGMGNGDLLLDSKEYMMPPPPQIESLLGNAVKFILSQLMSMSTNIFQTEESEMSGGSTRSSASNSASSFIAVLIGQLRVLHLSFPSSATLSQEVNGMLADCVHQLTDMNNSTSESSIHVVKLLTLSYAALSCGATYSGDNTLSRLIATCRTILNVKLSIPLSMKNDAKQTARSIFQYSKWGSLSLVVSNMMSETETHDSVNLENLYQSILESARSSVDSTPVIALPPLFECAISAGKHIAMFDGKRHSLVSSLQSVIETLFAVLEEDNSSSNWTYMLNEMCKLLFRGKLLHDEFKLSYSKDNCGPMPIMQAFEKLLRMGGNSKPYIFKTVVSRISMAWLGPDGEAVCDMGLCAIPYREHIVDLLLYKEAKFDESSAHMSEGEKWNALPESTDASSITRAFVLLFLSKLPSPEHMSYVVLKELIHVIIMKLIDISCTAPARGKAFISGSEVYAQMIRSWQALCLLSRFVTDDIASDVATRVYHAMSFTMHGQIRYFMEVFTIQCTRLHPAVFGQMYIREIGRNDLTLQHISSLMIIGGNLTVGRYSSSFFHSSSADVSAITRMKEVLCGVLPWLSSTQGFSRAIAQLLCHKLIPLVVNINEDINSANKSTDNSVKDSSVLRSIYFFLENNTEMMRLRTKQQLFFDAYDVDSVCSFEGILSIPVDEGEEANPKYMVDIIKDCLANIYQEANEVDAPVWKQLEDLLIEADDIANQRRQLSQPNNSNDDDGINDDTEELVNFQRKILPIDALDLGIRSYHETKLVNAAGQKKQSLIVCATLIDKVPNLAGLARTCEIFSAQSLILPNLLVRKQDDFKSISASANDWIEMEECKEEDLLNWLYKKKYEGYEIVGVEQTSSSQCLTKMEFHEKTVLLLGKEKEGIPIEFLSAVDQCIEIPQLGIIRSLNVHVSGAISIWEYTKQMMKKK